MWRDLAWVLDMLNAARKSLEYSTGLNQAEFLACTLRQDAIVRQLTIIGEAAKQVSEEFRASHPEIPWRKIAGFRDVAVHDYFNVDAVEVWRIVREDLPALVAQLDPLVPPKED